MSFRYNTAKEESLISLVFESPILWDKTIEKKSSKDMSEGWKQIANELDIESNYTLNQKYMSKFRYLRRIWQKSREERKIKRK